MDDELRRVQVERFLESRGLTIDDLLSFAPGIRHDETLLVSGSIAEGLGNSQSDIDLVYLGTGDLRGLMGGKLDETYEFDVTHDSKGNEINIERPLWAALERSSGRVRATLDFFRHPRGDFRPELEYNDQALMVLVLAKLLLLLT